MNIGEYQTVVGSTSTEFKETGLSEHLLFQWSILKMNRMYSLPVNQFPTLDNLNEPATSRMRGFMKTLGDEMTEGSEIYQVMSLLEEAQAGDDVNEFIVGSLESFAERLMAAGFPEKDATSFADEMRAYVLNEDNGLDPNQRLNRFILVCMADWLGDMMVYIRSEALKFGIPVESALACIMGSNFTKLGADGQPLTNDDGKVLKGPNFVPPERHIHATMFEQDKLIEEANLYVTYAEDLNAVAVPALADPMSTVLALDEDEVEYDALTDADEGELDE
jgi:hypothetical protein